MPDMQNDTTDPVPRARARARATRPRLVALDIDGTVVHPIGSVAWEVEHASFPSARVLQAVRALDAAGVAVVLASGRMYPGVRPVHTHLGLCSPLICQQGSAVHEPAGRLMHEFPLALDVAYGVIELARTLQHAYEWFTPLRYLVSTPNPASELYAELSGVKPEYVPAPEQSGIAPTGVGIISNSDEAPRIHALLEEQFGGAAHVLDFPGVTVCVAAEATKGRALELLAAGLGIHRSEAIAIGDSVNDAPMLEWAGRGYACSHGDRYALAAADEVLDMSASDAVADLLERIAAGEVI
jgi:HAD superfamily hydrolase (TIGR01484 family)